MHQNSADGGGGGAGDARRSAPGCFRLLPVVGAGEGAGDRRRWGAGSRGPGSPGADGGGPLGWSWADVGGTQRAVSPGSDPTGGAGAQVTSVRGRSKTPRAMAGGPMSRAGARTAGHDSPDSPITFRGHRSCGRRAAWARRQAACPGFRRRSCARAFVEPRASVCRAAGWRSRPRTAAGTPERLRCGRSSPSRPSCTHRR